MCREITRAYHKMALRYHPDKSSAADAEARFIRISEACAHFYAHSE